MNVSKSLLALVLSLAILAAACGTASTSASSPSTPQNPSGSSSGSTGSGTSSGEQLVNTRCTVCHSTDRIKAAKKTPQEWQATVQLMMGKGAQLNAGEADTVVKYLSERYK